MEELKSLVKKLETEYNEEEQIKILQDIGKKLLTEYVIQVGDVTIQPLWVEAYYRDIKKFDDESVHGNDKQKEFDCFYFHHKTDDQRSGVDICLSKGDYYLSYLLKYTLVNGVFTTQSQLSGKIPAEVRNKTGILVKKESPTDVLQCAKRIGISSRKFKDAKLAIVRDINQRFVNAAGQKKSLPQKIELVKEYIQAVYQEEERETEEQKAAISRLLVGEYWKTLFD